MSIRDQWIHGFIGVTIAGALALGVILGQGAFAEKEPVSLDVTFAMIWEGESPMPANAEQIQKFRSQYPSIKFLHFISPAYLSRRDKMMPAAIIDTARHDFRAVTGALIAGDATGIYLNGWKSTAAVAGVRFKKGPTFWGNELTTADCKYDCGREVMMTAYTFNDLRKIIRQSRHLFQTQGLGNTTAMLVAGNMASPEVIQAASAEGITHDFSAVAAQSIAGRFHRFPLRREMDSLWSGVGPEMQPFKLETTQGHILQMTSNGVHLALMSSDEIKERLDRVFAALKSDRTQPNRHLFVGVPAESFEISGSKLLLTVQELFKKTSEEKINLRWSAETIGGKPQADRNQSATSH